MASDRELVVICIHGLWMSGMEMGLLRRRLQKNLCVPAVQFSYHSVTEGIAENARRLSHFIDRFPADSVHLVGHSLGGVLALQMLKRFPTEKVDRVVCLGSPLVDSSAARQLSRRFAGRSIIGKTFFEAVLEQPLRRCDPSHDAGMITGRLALGLGRLVATLEEPNDGVVAQRETELPGLNDHLGVPVSHFGLLLAPSVARQIAHFLRYGSFERL
ncbi:MAG: alpha/beta hydrolase [Gammaproteobacteria bacterium]|nr:alpha/beta hydrolase [Gammaproteobacteria bacterium]